MDLELNGKVALVAGSSRGIGLAIVRTLLAEGARVVVTGRGREDVEKAKRDLQAVSGEDRVLSVVADLGDPAEIAKAVEEVTKRWGDLDILVANIGSGRGRAGWDADGTEWQRLCEINLFSSVRLATAVLPAMVKRKRGSIVFVGSITGIESTTAPLAYSSAKAALLHYVKNLSRQVLPPGLRVNAVAPGNVLFQGGSWEKHLESRREEVMRYIENEVPMRRFGDPTEIADAVAFLCSERASFITGVCLVVDGGQTRTL